MRSFWIVVNTECNMRCKHCFETDFKKGKLDIDYVKVFLSKLTHKAQINIFGGEPTMYMEHLLEIIGLIRDSGLAEKITIFTNGKFDFKKYETQLLEFKDIIHWQISIQTTDRNKDGVKSEIPTLDWIIENNFRFTVSTVMVVDGQEDIKGIIEYMIEKNVIGRLFLAPNRMERDMQKLGEVIEYTMKLLIDDAIQNEVEYFPSIIDRIFNTEVSSCTAFNTQGISMYSTLGVDGKMYSCHHASNIGPSNSAKKDILNNSLPVEDWSPDKSEYMCAVKPLHKVNGVMSCPMECDGCEELYDESAKMISNLKKKIQSYIRGKLIAKKIISEAEVE